MTKRLSSKLLSVILTLAICATTVLGCLITAYAAATSCYSFSAAVFDEDDLTQATMDLTFTTPENMPNGFVSGAFNLVEVDADSTDCLTVKSVVAKTEGVNLVNEGSYYIFDGESAGFNTVTFEITFGFSNGVASEGTTYKVKLTDVELAYNDNEYFIQTADGAIGEITTSCKHVVTVVGEPVATGTDDNAPYGYAVYEQSVCVLCGELFGYQLVPTAEALDNADAAGTIDLLEFGTYLTDAGSTSQYYDTVVADNGETGADWDNAIIIDSAEELVYLCKGSGNETAGLYYKVADGIAGFNLSTSALDINGTLADNLAVIQGSGKNHAGGAPGFQGHFDGNGVTVYGAWTNHTSVSPYAGLFSCVQGDVTIKNVNVKLSSFTATTAAGGIVGYHYGDGTNTLTIENCSVTDCHFEVTTAGSNHGIGALVGRSANLSSWNEADEGVDGNGDGDMVDTIYVNGKCLVNNCYVNIDPDYFVSATAPGTQTDTSVRSAFGGVVGWMSSNGLAVDKCVVIGVTPYAVSVCTTNNDVQHMGLESHFTNVYTDQPAGSAVSIGGSSLGTRNFTGRVTQLTLANMKGSAAVTNMTALDWGTTWVMDGTNTYPRLALPGETSDIIYWDGTNTKTAPTVGSGTPEDPYIISTVAEFAYITGQARDSYTITDGQYYKIADGIKSIVMQPYAYRHDIMALASAAETKAYFEANAANMKQWLYYGWEGSTFCGNIDFNGATVYGAYIKDSASNAALISNLDAGAVISNLTLKNSYFTSAAGNYQVGAIAAVTNGASYGKATNGFVWMDNCTVANNYLYNSSTATNRSGLLIGASNDIIYIDNCLTYGNDATYGDGVTMPVWGTANNGVLVSSAPAIPDGLTVVDDGAATEPRYYNMVRNSIILGAKPYNLSVVKGSRFNDPKCYENVYTDADVATDTFSDGNVLGATDEQIKTISASDALGLGAETAMPNLTWGTDWFTGDEGEYPAQSAYVTVGVSNVSNPDFVIAGTSVVYANDGSFSLNIHYIPAYEGFAPTLYVGDTNCKKLYILDTPVESSKRDEIGDQTAMMFTLSGLSARYIDTLWHPTLVAQQGASLDWSQSAELSIADNARAIIAGDYDTADKNVSYAVLMYGNASTAALGVTSSDYSAGTIDLLEFGTYLTDAGSTSQYYDTVVADNGETGADWDNAIIIDSAEELVYLCKGSGNETAGLYYKVADGIAGFNLSTSALDINGTLADNLAVIQGSGKNHAGGAPGFQGHFDGNGATVYGAVINSNTYAGLFSCTYGDVTIKNINVKLSRFVGTVAAGGIVGYHKADDATSTLLIENCSVTDSHLETTGTSFGTGVGAIIGHGASAPSWKEADKGVDGNGDGDMVDTIYENVPYIIKNCYVNLDENYFISVAEDGTEATSERTCHGGVVGFLGSNALAVSNCVVIGITPYATSESSSANDVQHTGLASHFSNVYTTSDVAITGVEINKNTSWTAGQVQDYTGRIFPLSTEQMTGIAAKDNMPNLDWNTVWTTTDGYPTFINKDYVAPDSGYAIYWDGSSTKTAPSVGSGQKDDPYIINTVAELAYIFGQTRDNYAITDGKYYKLADGIKSIVMQPEAYAADIMALGSAADVKTYFEANAANMKQWLYYGWEGSTFCGDIDFNGATVYGIYQISSSNTGLISNVDAGAVVRNVGIKNSYMVGNASAANYQVGALASVSNGDSYGKAVKGVVWFNGITIANNYLYNNSTSGDRSGVLMASSGDAVYSDNILVYGNDATYGDGVKMPLIGTANNNTSSTAAVPEDLVVKLNSDLHVCAVRNSIILGTTPYDPTQVTGSRFNDLANSYENVYTDADLVNDTFSNGTSVSSIKGATQVTDLATLKGDAAQSVVDTLNTANGSTVWYVGAAGDYPGFKEAGTLNANLQAIYDGIVLTPDTYLDSGLPLFNMYATSVNLNTNPYMSFAFEFGGDYKTNRDKITVTFTYTVNGTEYTHITTPPPAVDSDNDGVIDEIKNVNGWYNRPAAGRFHTYRFTGVPVEALANPIKISASYDGTNYDLGSFSVGGLAYEFECQNKVTPSDYYATRIEAVKALLFYTQMVHARYGAQ